MRRQVLTAAPEQELPQNREQRVRSTGEEQDLQREHHALPAPVKPRGDEHEREADRERDSQRDRDRREAHGRDRVAPEGGLVRTCRRGEQDLADLPGDLRHRCEREREGQRVEPEGFGYRSRER